MKPPFIVAEMSANHNGSLNRALEIVEAAADAGADAIKVQTWSSGTMCIDRNHVIERGAWAGRKLVDLYEQAWLPWEWHHTIFRHARLRGLVPFSAAFDRQAVDFLEELRVDRHKVASFELTDLPLIRYMASKGKPMILSTGMASTDEVTDAMLATEECPVTLLKCTSAYPAPAESMNLDVLWGWRHAGFGSGLSDHTHGHEAAMLATALGATMIEKHLTLSRADGGLDAAFSLEPEEFKDMVQAVKRAAAMMGEARYGPTEGEEVGLRRSLWVAKDTCTGGFLVLGDNLVTARPGLGLPPAVADQGKVLRARRPLFAGQPLRQEDVA